MEAQSKTNLSDIKISGSTSDLKGSDQNELIRRYERIKRIARICILLLFVTGVIYVILIALSEQVTQPIFEEGVLGRNAAFSGNNILLPALRDGRVEFLFSSNGGSYFERTGDSWPLPDTNIFLAITPDSATLIALESKGALHIKKNAASQFQTTQLNISARDSAYGLTVVPGTDSVYIFGSFEGVISLSLNAPDRQILIHLPDSASVRSLALDSQKNCLCILYKKYRSPWIWVGNSITSLQPLYLGKPPSKINIFKKDSSADISTGQEILVGYEPITKTWYHVYWTFMGPLRTYLQYLNHHDDSTHNIFSPRYEGLYSAKLDTSGFPAFYHYGPYIDYRHNLDSLPEASTIITLGFNNTGPCLALIRNYDKYFLYQKNTGTWKMNPVLVKRNVFATVRSMLGVFEILLSPDHSNTDSYRLYDPEKNKGGH